MLGVDRDRGEQRRGRGAPHWSLSQAAQDVTDIQAEELGNHMCEPARLKGVFLGVPLLQSFYFSHESIESLRWTQHSPQDLMSQAKYR